MLVWQMIEPTDRNDGRTDPDTGERNGPATCRRVYGKHGEQYPRRTIAVTQAPMDDEVYIACSGKESANEAWFDTEFPKELLADVIDLIDQFEKGYYN